MNYIQKGTREFRLTSIALFAGGFNTFAILYCTQPLMPFLSKEFGVSPTVASLSLSVTTCTLAVSMLFFGSLSEVLGRKSIMCFSLFASSILAVLSAFVPNFSSLLIIRCLQGFVLAGLPAIAMAYISEEVDKSSLGMVMGLYISGNSIGGMSGRIIIGVITDFFNWRLALGTIGFLGLIASFLFWSNLPASKHFVPRTFEIKKLIKSSFNHLKNPKLLCLYCIGFLIMGSFVSLYNFIGYQLIEQPYNLSQTLVSLIFVMYIFGTFSSTFMGRMADKHGQDKMLYVSIFIMLFGICTTLNVNLFLKIVGIAFLTFGFFGGHSIASSWIGKLSTHDKAQASSLYLLFYYVGSSIGGTAGGRFWSLYGWSGVVSMISSFLLIAFLILFALSSILKHAKVV
ncbi:MULTISPECIES: MFS transporter [unclassified Clostridium]|uniref:MFS transporter n=1 Tax=unclassified Clostridium TaxID=2614128 RepID=UPI000297D1D8|nr:MULTISPECIES: MFS transporter [unclassified Clostridium]EKQ56625.1 MAG: arabinose efflux permease family protein [Clostridium sp. Maddingley MBC34-26]